MNHQTQWKNTGHCLTHLNKTAVCEILSAFDIVHFLECFRQSSVLTKIPNALIPLRLSIFVLICPLLHLWPITAFVTSTAFKCDLSREQSYLANYCGKSTPGDVNVPGCPKNSDIRPQIPKTQTPQLFKKKDLHFFEKGLHCKFVSVLIT